MRPAFIFLESNYLASVVIFGSSSFTVDDFDPIVPVAKRSPPPTTITMRAPMRTPMTPIPPLLSAMHISSGCQLDAIQCFGCTFVPHFVRQTETAECLLLPQSGQANRTRECPLLESNSGHYSAQALNG